MKILRCFIIIFLLAVSSYAQMKCAVCVVLLGLFDQIHLNGVQEIGTAMKHACIAAPHSAFRNTCETLLNTYGERVIAGQLAGKSPDEQCQTLKFCDGSCTLFTVWPPVAPAPIVMAFAERLSVARSTGAPEHMAHSHWHALFAASARAFKMYDELAAHFVVDTPPGVISTNASKYLPVFDKDGDYFSTVPGLRGSHWRGKDCDDGNAHVYAGRANDTVGPTADHNCNGISGSDSSGMSFEEKFCSQTQSLGYIGLGDSAMAHFSVPPSWVTPQNWTLSRLSNLVSVLEDSADWPQCSAGSGYMIDPAECPDSVLPMDSFYLRLRERNLCNHRDYQNIGVNGANMRSMHPPGVIEAMKSRNGVDQAAVVVLRLVGNDVCSHNHDFSHMTQPAEFTADLIQSLQYLDQNLAPGSHVLLVGLADGRVLYDTMHAQRHPIGTTYTELYDFLNCQTLSPCWGWMNSNQTVRELTQAHAFLLNDQFPAVINSSTFNNFDLHYMFPDFQLIIDNWEAQGRPGREIIEAVDGFHPSQTGNVLFSAQVWDHVAGEVPQFIGEINPNNDAIIAQFGEALNGY